MRTHAKKDDFITKIIYDLKSPTAAQIKALELFLSTTSNKISSEEKELIELTLNSCNYMQNLIETFSAVYKLEHEQMHLYYSKFNVSELINKIKHDLEILLKYHELKIEINIQEDMIINADKTQIKRVIDNIISNAINHSFKNSTIYLNAFINKNILTVKIQNNSPYIEEDALKDIFEKHKTHSLRRNRVGAGLGLYLSKEIINAHYGQMIAKSYPDDVNILGFEVPIR